ncbi:MAG: ImmA/IrrE family metallo-endopeptidase, partial [Planctomycetota bacterium]
MSGFLGVSDIVECDMHAEGYVEGSFDSGFRIALKKGQPSARRRFSWAHELGHILIDQLEGCEDKAVGRRYRDFAAVSTELDV